MIYFSKEILRKICCVPVAIFLVIAPAPFTLSSLALDSIDGDASKITASMLSEENLQAIINDVAKLLEDYNDNNSCNDYDYDHDHDMIGDFSNSMKLMSASKAAAVLDEIDEITEDLTSNMERLESLTEKMLAKTSSVEYLLKEANSRQLDNLINRLFDTLDAEKEIRKMEQDYVANIQNLYFDNNGDGNEENGDDDDLSNIVTHSMLQKRLDTHAIVEESELAMKKWILSLIEEEFDTYKENILGNIPIDNIDEYSDSDNDTDNKNCPSTTSIVQKVQQGLQNYADDGIGKIDHAQGANVIHSMTSETFSPEISKYTSDGSRYEYGSSLGSVWWNKFIPQDWERYLPADWEQWNVAIPSYVYHSLVRLCFYFV